MGRFGAYDVCLLPLRQLVEHEHINAKRAEDVLQQMRTSHLIDYPLLIETDSSIILDGHHRYNALFQMGCELAPCVLVDINDDALQLQARREDVPVSKSKFISRVLSANQLFPEKTTRFTIEPNLSAVNLSLDRLE